MFVIVLTPILIDTPFLIFGRKNPLHMWRVFALYVYKFLK